MIVAIGEALSLYARAHTQSTSRTLHREASRYRGKLRVDGEHSPIGTTPATSQLFELPSTCRTTRFVSIAHPETTPDRTNRTKGHIDGPSFYKDPYSYDPPGRSSDEYRRGSILPTTDAAGVLAQLHTQRPDTIHWDAEPVGQIFNGLSFIKPDTT
jgi:hypothetical protein